MQIEMYTDDEGLKRLKHHEKWLGKATIDFVVNFNGGNFTSDYLRDETDGRYAWQHYLVHLFNVCDDGGKMGDEGDQKIIHDREEIAFYELVSLAEDAIGCWIASIDSHFKAVVVEILKIPQLKTYHKDVLTIWQNYTELAKDFGFLLEEDGGLCLEDPKDYDYSKHFCDEAQKRFGKYYYEGVIQHISKNTQYPQEE